MWTNPDTRLCRQWLLGCGCRNTVEDECCRYGAHFVTEEQKADAEALVRAVAAAEGRDAKAFTGIEDDDMQP